MGWFYFCGCICMFVVFVDNLFFGNGYIFLFVYIKCGIILWIVWDYFDDIFGVYYNFKVVWNNDFCVLKFLIGIFFKCFVYYICFFWKLDSMIFFWNSCIEVLIN